MKDTIKTSISIKFSSSPGNTLQSFSEFKKFDEEVANMILKEAKDLVYIHRLGGNLNEDKYIFIGLEDSEGRMKCSTWLETKEFNV